MIPIRVTFRPEFRRGAPMLNHRLITSRVYVSEPRQVTALARVLSTAPPQSVSAPSMSPSQSLSSPSLHFGPFSLLLVGTQPPPPPISMLQPHGGWPTPPHSVPGHDKPLCDTLPTRLSHWLRVDLPGRLARATTVAELHVPGSAGPSL